MIIKIDCLDHRTLGIYENNLTILPIPDTDSPIPVFEILILSISSRSLSKKSLRESKKVLKNILKEKNA